MKIIKFKRGDFVFYKDKYGATHSTKVWSVARKRVLVENWDTSFDEFGKPRPVAVYVKPDNLILQSEWEKQNS